MWPSGRLPSRGRKWGHWSGVWDMIRVDDEDTTTMSMTSFWCLCCFLWTCFALLSDVSVFGFGHVGISWTLFGVNTYFYIFYSSSGFGKSWAVGWLVLWTEYYKKNTAKAPQIDLMLKIDTLKISYVFTFILVLILSSFLAIKSIFLKMLKQILNESFIFTFVSSTPVNLNHIAGQWVCSITATLLSVIFVIYGIANHFETWCSFHMCSLSIYSPRLFEVFILKFIKSKVSHNSDMFESNSIHQYITTIWQSVLAWRSCP